MTLCWPRNLGIPKVGYEWYDVIGKRRLRITSTWTWHTTRNITVEEVKA